jgi:hypothetical protein
VRRLPLLAAIAVAAGLLTAGCSSGTEAENTTEDANAAVCLSLKGLGATIEGLSTGVTGTGDVTVSQAQEAVNQIDGAYDSVQRNLAALGTDVEDQVLTAQQQYEEAQMQVKEGLSGLDGDQSLSEVPQEQASAISTLESSYQQLNDSLGCSD